MFFHKCKNGSFLSSWTSSWSHQVIPELWLMTSQALMLIVQSTWSMLILILLMKMLRRLKLMFDFDAEWKLISASCAAGAGRWHRPARPHWGQLFAPARLDYKYGNTKTDTGVKNRDKNDQTQLQIHIAYWKTMKIWKCSNKRVKNIDQNDQTQIQTHVVYWKTMKNMKLQQQKDK